MTTISAILVAFILSMGVVPPASATLTTDACGFVFIGVRGTNATPGYAPVASHGNRIWWQGGMGGVSNLQGALQNASDYPFYIASLNYPASDGAGYAASVMTGRNTLVAELNWLANQCGTNWVPSVVLAGHSQGAVVVLNALVEMPGYPNLTAKAKASIQAVTTFGDPNFNPNGYAYNATPVPGTATGLLGARWSSYNDQLNLNYLKWGWPMGSTDPNPQAYSRIRNLCYTGDYFCDPTWGAANAMDIHNSYNASAMQYAKSWIEYMLEYPS